MLHETGPAAAAIVKLWWVLLGIGCFVVLAVTGFVVIGVFRSGRRGLPPVSERSLGFAVIGAMLLTLILLLAILVESHRFAQPLADRRDEAFTIDVVGKRWWWSILYRDRAGRPLFETANEIHIPVGAPVRLRLLSDNVIHSFWVPALNGKVDLIPGRTNFLWLLADEAGVYRGQCAEFCGIQHAKMAFLVIADPPERFERWLLAQRASAKAPATALARRGQEVFTSAACAQCHTIRGVSEISGASLLGPDLTHLASRRTLAAGTLPNRKGHLAGWIADPQSNKPGSLMPAVPMPAEQFHALLHYLETLE